MPGAMQMYLTVVFGWVCTKHPRRDHLRLGLGSRGLEPDTPACVPGLEPC